MSALDDLVKAGKVRYIGVSDTPAWKVAQAQLTAQFRGWSPLIALQIEYSLMQRTVEGELVPMAEELGLGVLPWSPLKSGVLTGKYTRANGAKMPGMRGAFAGDITEKQYDIIDALGKISAECQTDSSTVGARVAECPTGGHFDHYRCPNTGGNWMRTSRPSISHCRPSRWRRSTPCPNPCSTSPRISSARPPPSPMREQRSMALRANRYSWSRRTMDPGGESRLTLTFQCVKGE